MGLTIPEEERLKNKPDPTKSKYYYVPMRPPRPPSPPTTPNATQPTPATGPSEPPQEWVDNHNPQRAQVVDPLEPFRAAKLPQYWLDWFPSAYGPMQDYYNEPRGGVDQAVRDYQTFVNRWADVVNRNLTPDEASNLLRWYTASMGPARQVAPTPPSQPIAPVATTVSTPTLANLFAFMSKYMAPTPKGPPVSYLKLGEY